MGNRFFKFKQFTIYHDACGMKVGTDGVLLGAWCGIENARQILDIGTGSGLIALMAAQRSTAQIDAVEINTDAFHQAKMNIANSPWSDRIEAFLLDFKQFASKQNKRYDHILSNPPYFIESLLPTGEARRQARHTDSLNYRDLFKGARALLDTSGKISIIYPYELEKEIEREASDNQLYLSRKTYVRGNSESLPKRVLAEWKLSTPQNCMIDELVIEKERHLYTPEYISLTREFYLKM